MDSLFRRCLNTSAVAHGALAFAVVASPFVLTAFRGEEPRRAPLQIYTVDVTSAPSPQSHADAVESAPPVPSAERPIVKPKPKPLAKPALNRTPARTTPQPARATGRATDRPATAASRTSRSRLSEEDIRRHLARGAVPGTETVIPADEDFCFERIRCALYTAWQQPSAEEASGIVVEAEIAFAADGRITAWRLVRRSGIASMDRSVVEALQTVNRVTGLSAAFLRSRDTVTIAFRVGE